MRISPPSAVFHRAYTLLLLLLPVTCFWDLFTATNGDHINSISGNEYDTNVTHYYPDYERYDDVSITDTSNDTGKRMVM